MSELSDEHGQPTPEYIAKLKEAAEDVQEVLAIKRRNGRYALGFIVELAHHQVTRTYHVHNIHDEIGKLEGTDTTPSITKPEEPFDRAPLIGLWHKHHFQAQFLPMNLRLETSRMAKDGSWEEIFAPHYGRYMHEVAGQIVHQMVHGAYSRRAADHRMTGEFIVFERREDGSNYYLTLGQHGEYDAIRARVEEYKLIEQKQGR
jgi:hypothetical protein